MAKKSILSNAKSYVGTAGRSKSNISRDTATELLEFYEANGAFTIPVTDFNQSIGISDSTARAWQIKRILNKMHSDLLDKTKEWRVGQTAQNTLYVFSLGIRKEE